MSSNGQQIGGNENAENLIDFRPDLISQENLLKEFRNSKSDLLILTKEMENLRMANKRNILEIEFKFAEKISTLNSSFEKRNSEIEQKLAKLEMENEELKNKNAKLEEAIDELKQEIVGMKNENVKNEQKLNEKNEKEKQKEADAPNGDGVEIGSNENKILAVEINQQMTEGKIELKNADQLDNTAELSELEVPILSKEIGKLSEKSDKSLQNAIKIDFGKMYNEWDWKPQFTLGEDQNGLLATHSGGGISTICAVWPSSKVDQNANKPQIVSYFEVHIFKFGSIRVGFCDSKFSLEKICLGNGINSIGIWRKGIIHINGTYDRFGNRNGIFEDGDNLGIGLIYFPADDSLKFFAICNGELLGTKKLPSKFIGLRLFPAATICRVGDAIQANFGKNRWRYNPSLLLNKE